MAWYKPTPDETRENWRKVRLMGRLYRLAILLPFVALCLLAIWGNGYAHGLLAACSAPRTETISKESSHVR